MDTIAFIKRVPDTSEAEAIQIGASGMNIEGTGLPFKINNWDEYVLETAAQLKEKLGGTFTAVTAGNKDWNDVLRRALAMGADQAIRIDEDVSGWEPNAVALILKAVIKPLPFDLLLFGAQSEDFGSGQLGVTVAEMLGIPHAALVAGMEPGEKSFRIQRELEAGTLESYTVALPALFTIQTGINQPRYISLSGIRRATKMEIQVLSLGDIGLSREGTVPKLKLEKMELPPKGKKAEMISGSPGEAAARLAKILQSSGIF
jgi:electron transfer flavoprotein beta subunit